MTQEKKRIEPKPIDLTLYEDEFLEIPEVNHSQGFGAWIQVQSHQNGKVVQKNLWDTANPVGQWGKDGFLSYEEAKGKTFVVPMAFCNSPGTIYVDVRNGEDFENLRGVLAAPLRTHLFSVHSCSERKEEPSPLSPNQLPNPDSMERMLDSIKTSTDGTSGAELDQALKIVVQSGVSNFVSGLAQGATASSIEMGLKVAFENASTSIGQMLDSSEPAVDCEGDEDCEAWLRGESSSEDDF